MIEMEVHVCIYTFVQAEWLTVEHFYFLLPPIEGCYQ